MMILMNNHPRKAWERHTSGSAMQQEILHEADTILCWTTAQDSLNELWRCSDPTNDVVGFQKREFTQAFASKNIFFEPEIG